MPLANPRRGGARAVEVVKTEEKGSDVNLATCIRGAAGLARVRSADASTSGGGLYASFLDGLSSVPCAGAAALNRVGE